MLWKEVGKNGWLEIGNEDMWEYWGIAWSENYSEKLKNGKKKIRTSCKKDDKEWGWFSVSLGLEIVHYGFNNKQRSYRPGEICVHQIFNLNLSCRKVQEKKQRMYGSFIHPKGCIIGLAKKHYRRDWEYMMWNY